MAVGCLLTCVGAQQVGAIVPDASAAVAVSNRKSANMSIEPISIRTQPVKSVDLPPDAALRADAVRKPAVSAAVAELVDRIVANAPFPKDHRHFARIALHDLAAEFASGRPDLSKDIGPGASLAGIIRSDPVFAAVALRLFHHLSHDHKLDGTRAAKAYESLRECVSPAVVKAASPDILALMNSFAPLVNTHLSGAFVKGS